MKQQINLTPRPVTPPFGHQEPIEVWSDANGNAVVEVVWRDGNTIVYRNVKVYWWRAANGYSTYDSYHMVGNRKFRTVIRKLEQTK